MALMVVLVFTGSCWLKNGAWRPPCDEPYLAKTAASPLLFVRSGFILGIFVASFSHNSHLAFWFWLAPFLFYLMIFLVYSLNSYHIMSLFLYLRETHRANAASLYKVAFSIDTAS